MKLTRKLIPAMIMLLVSAVLMSTASFAWFAMRDEVTATGMNVTATADAIFLEIKGTEDDAFSATGTNALNESLKPVAHKTEGFTVGSLSTPGDWYVQYSDDPGDPDSNLTAQQSLTNLTGYVASTTYSVQLNEDYLDDGYDLYVSSMTIPANSGIKVIVAGANGFQEFSAPETEGAVVNTFDASKILSNTVSTSAQTITVYIYIDGNDENVFSNNVAELTGAVTFKLKAFPTDQNPTP